MGLGNESNDFRQLNDNLLFVGGPPINRVARYRATALSPPEATATPSSRGPSSAGGIATGSWAAAVEGE